MLKPFGLFRRPQEPPTRRCAHDRSGENPQLPQKALSDVHGILQARLQG
jgi:hypothetical protein